MGRNKERVRYFMNDRSIMEDNHAMKSGGQIITELLGGSALPVREPTVAYQFRANNRAPVKVGSAHVETTDPVSHDMDSWFLSAGGPAIWKASYQGLGGLKKKSEDWFTNRWVNIIAALAGCAFAFIALVGTQWGGGDTAVDEENQKAVPALPAVQQELSGPELEDDRER